MGLKRVRYWDLAASEAGSGGDWTVGCLLSRAEERTETNAAPISIFTIEDLIRGQWSPHDRDERIMETAEVDGKRVEIWLEQEPGSAGKSLVQILTNWLAGYTVHGDRPTGELQTRANPLASQLEAGNVRIVRAPWNAALRAEFLSFPHGRHDDIVAAASGGFNVLAGELRRWWQDKEMATSLRNKAVERAGRTPVRPAWMG